MSANAHTAVMTDLEQRIQDGRQLSAPRPRINRIMEDRFYGRKPRVDIQRAVLFTQSMMQTEAYPQVLRTALAIQYMMEHIEVVIQPHELIVGTAGGPGRYCVLYPETRGGQFPRDLPKILKAEGKAGYAMTQAEVDTVLNEVVPYWKGKTSHELYLNMLPRETRRVIYGDEEYATQGLIFDEANNAHTLSWTGSYEKVIREGLESIIRELEERKAGIEGNLLHNQMDKIYYLDAAILSCKAMITYAHRYADRAEAMAAEESDPVRRAELETIAEICRHVPEHPARNFYEAVQAQWFLQVGYRLENMNGGGVGLGRLDQYLYPLYKAGLEDGTLTEERAMEILECMFIKVGEVVPYQGKSTAGGHEGYTHFEALSLGGLTPDGRDATNPLTYLILRSKKEFPFQYPDVSLRGIVMEPGLTKTPMFVEDERIFPLYERCQALGVPVMLMVGSNCGPDIEYSKPEYAERVAKAFPKLNIILSHGGWPWVTEAIHVAYRYKNVYLLPDLYQFNGPGSGEYLAAANYILRDQMLFGSAYPYVSLREAVDYFLEGRLRPVAQPAFLAGNARRILELERV